jgi:hypothetical protein
MDFLKFRKTCGRLYGTVTECLRPIQTRAEKTKITQRHGAPGPWKQKLTYKEASDRCVLGYVEKDSNLREQTNKPKLNLKLGQICS